MLKVQNLISLKYLTHNHWKYNVNKEHMFPCWIFRPKTWEYVLFVNIIFSVIVSKIFDRNKVLNF